MITKDFKLTSKRQITVPQSVLLQLGVGPGDSVYFETQGKHIVIKAGHEQKLSALDMHKQFKPLVTRKVSLDEINGVIREGYEARSRKIHAHSH